MSNQRFSLVGTSGSGKTTLAQQISQRLNISHVELDALHWEPNWVEAQDPVLRKRTEQALSSNRWVVDGSYRQVRDLVWGKADTVVWLDYTLSVIIRRLLRRTWRRVVRQEKLWSGNRQTWQTTFSRDSILLWALQTYQKRKTEYSALFKQPEYSHLTVVHLQSPQAANNWLSNLTM